MEISTVLELPGSHVFTLFDIIRYRIIWSGSSATLWL